MKKLSKGKKILALVLIVILGIMAIGTEVFATSEGNGVVIIGPNTANNNTDNTNIIGNTNNTNVANPANNLTNYNTTNTTNTANNSTNLPKTGIEDYSIGFIIAICAISAIFAYKKIRDYQI